MEKIISTNIIVIVAMLLVCSNGCTTNRASTSDDVFKYQEQLADREATISRYEATIGVSVQQLESLGKRAGEMENTIDGTIELFDEYQRIVEQLIREYYSIRGTISNKE